MKIYKRELLNGYNIRFVPDVHPMEDTIFNLEYLRVCKSVKYVDQGFYHYRIHEESSTFGIRKNRYENLENGFAYLKSHYINDTTVRDEIYYWAVGMIWFALSRQSFNRKCFTTYKQRKEDFLKHTQDYYIKDIIQNANYSMIPKSKRIMLWFYKQKNAMALEIMCRLFELLRRKQG
jgi:hypothetical protein